MSVLHARPAHLARSRVCHALGLSRTGTYPRQRTRRRKGAPLATQPRRVPDEQRRQVLELVGREEYQDASVRVIYARELSAGFPVAWTISRKENAAVARHLIAHALKSHAIEPGRLVVHQDRGAPMIAHTYREFLDSFGVRRSYLRPRVSNDNAFKTIKYSPGYAGRFADIDDARAWITGFIADYQNRPHDGLNVHTSADVFHGRFDVVHAVRQAALDIHYAAHPERYPNGAPRAKQPPAAVSINPEDGLTSAAFIIGNTAVDAPLGEPDHFPSEEKVM